MDKKLEGFIATIYEDAENEGSALESELSAKRDAYLRAADDELLEEVYAYIRSATTRIRTEAGRRVSQKIFEQKRELHRCRREILDQIVADARARVEEYTKTAEYSAALEQLANFAEKKLGGEDMTIYLRPQDMVYADRIAALVRAKVKEGEVELGGLVAVNPHRRLRLDLSYDSALEKAAEDFSRMPGAEA